VKAKVTIDENREVIVTLVPDDEENLVRGITVIVEGDDRPIMRTPFFIHHGERQLHTVCQIDHPDRIDRVDW
jgi:hypothetical protein